MKMSASDPEAWFSKAESDYLTIRKGMVGDDVPWDAVAFHAQQAAEKYLKGFLVARGSVVPKIHDLVSLLTHCRRHDPSLESLSADAELLTRLGWASRYPDTPGDPQEADSREAVQIAQRITAAIRERVPKSSAP
jgi:HEPN domain-containing protein